MDIPWPFDLRHHEYLQLAANLGNHGEQVIEDPRTVEAVDAGPERGVPEVVFLRDFNQAFARRLLVQGWNRVLQVAEQDIHPRDELRDLGADLLVLGGEEMDHAIRA